MKKLLSSLAILIAVCVVVIIALRPSFTDFKHFADEPGGKRMTIVLRQTGSGIFATYFIKEYYHQYSDNAVLYKYETYRGFLKNFNQTK